MHRFKVSNVEREIEVYGYDSVIKSSCRMCHGGCGVLIYMKEGRVAKIAGDPDCPINHGTLCSKGIASPQIAYHPDRLTYPVRRIGPKGSGKWKRISWDEALDTIADKLTELKGKYGPQCLGASVGEPKALEFVWLQRFCSAFGTPNIRTPSNL